MKFPKKIPLKTWVICLTFLVILLASSLRAFNNFELYFYDLLFKLKPPQKISSDIAIIEISDDTLSNLGTWPLPRDFHANLIDILREFKARSIVFDILFSESSAYDEILSESIKKAKNVYLPLAFDIKENKRREYSPAEAKSILAGVSQRLSLSIKGKGHINSPVDPDGKRRRVPLFIKYKGKFIPQLALKVASDYLNLNLEKVEFERGKVIIDNRLFLPVSFNTFFMVNYPDKWEDSFKHISYFDILKAYSEVKKGLKPSFDLSTLKNKVCFIGLTAVGTSDFKPVPLENIYPMVGVQASIFNSLINQEFITEAGVFLNTLINLIIFLLSLVICLRFIPLKSFLSNSILALAYFLLALAVFVFLRLWVDLFFPLFIIASTYMAVTLYKILDETRKRQLLEKELDIARKIQKSFLPKKIKELPPLKISCFFQPAKFVAGDLYDILALDEKKLGVFIGDVSGKGAPASLIMAQTVSLFRVFSRLSSNPAEVLTELNKELAKVLEGRFVTALYLIVDTQNNLLTASSAGHSPVIFYKESQRKVSEFTPSSGAPLGIIEGLEYEFSQISINSKDKFVLYTDGLTEARNKEGEEFGEKRIKNLLFRHRDSPSDSIIDSLKREWFSFYKGLPQHDDITAILLEIGK